MSTETDIAEIKTTLVGLDNKFSEYVKHAQQLCALMHEPINRHLSESDMYRDCVNRNSGKITVILAILAVVLVGVMSIAYFVIQKGLT